MNRKKQRGQLLSIDAAIWFLAILASTLLFIQFQAQSANLRTENLSAHELERTALAKMDSLVKNRVEHNPGYGSAIRNLNTRRVESQRLDRKLLGQILAAQETEKPTVFFQQLFLEYEDGTQENILEKPVEDPSACLHVQRLIEIGNQAALLKGKICHA